jgi:hypothetical protein
MWRIEQHIDAIKQQSIEHSIIWRIMVMPNRSYSIVPSMEPNGTTPPSMTTAPLLATIIGSIANNATHSSTWGIVE